MKNRDRVETWEECEQRLLQIEAENRQSLTGVWFRGLPDASWGLTTTLERRTARSYLIEEYHDLICRVKPTIETFTNSRWEIPEWSAPTWPIEVFFRNTMPYDYMAHLRHHGFPSPLLDWSRSPYVAAYFAFAQGGPAHDVAIYSFSETPTNIKSQASAGPKIISHGGYALRTHERHFRQQSSYTVCVEQDQTAQRWKFVPHTSIFAMAETGQDVLYETIVPSTERTKVLKYLDRFNLNAFSLFGSEESLMEMLACREIDLRSTP